MEEKKNKTNKKASEVLLGIPTSHRNQIKAREVKKREVRGRSKSPREATIVVAIIGEKNFEFTGKVEDIAARD